MIIRRWSLCLLCFIFLARNALASTQNYTVDDADYSLEYSENWSTACAITLLQPCPDPSQMYDGTFHWVVYNKGSHHAPNVTLRFTGTAVYVYNVLVNDPSTFPPAVIHFTLDGDMVGGFSQPPSTTQGFTYVYQSLVYSHSGLSNREHVLVIQATAGNFSLIMLDYIKYTTQVDDQTPLPQGPQSGSSPPISPTSSLSNVLPPPGTSIPSAPLTSDGQSSEYLTATRSATPGLTVGYVLC